MATSQQVGGSNWNKPVFGRRRACRYMRVEIMMREVKNNDLQDMFLHEGVKAMT